MTRHDFHRDADPRWWMTWRGPAVALAALILASACLIGVLG